jgi:hypothetical protein
MSARTVPIHIPPEPDANVYRERAALILAKQIAEIPDVLARQRAIVRLILDNKEHDPNRAVFHPRLAALNGGGN